MIAATRKMLGLALNDNSIWAVEILSAQGEKRVRRAAEFRFPEGASWQDPAQLGKLLSRFLRRQRFSTRRAVLGLPANWLMSREISVPPADAAATTQVVLIQAEREFSSDPADLSLDFAASAAGEGARTALLVAVMRGRLEQVVALARAAGLKAQSITSSALAMAAASRASHGSCEITLLLQTDGADVVTRSGPGYRALTHVAFQPAEKAGGVPDALLGELRRTLAGVACAVADGQDRLLTIWAEAGLATGAAADLSAQFGLQTRVNESLAGLGVRAGGEANGSGPVAFLSAAALAAAGLRPERPALDWLHSRLAPPRRKWSTRETWAAAIGIAAFAAVIAMLAVWRHGRSEVGLLKARLAGMQGSLSVAQATLDRLASARDWYEDRPRALDALLALSAAFPPEGRAYITNITIKPATGAKGKGMSGSLIARSPEERAALDTLDRLKNSAAFSDLKWLYTRAAGRNSREITFAISFTYFPAE